MMLMFDGVKYVIEVPQQLRQFIQDVIKYMLILVTYHVMLYSKDGTSSSVSAYVEQSIYLTLGLAIYWFIYDKLIMIKST